MLQDNRSSFLKTINQSFVLFVKISVSKKLLLKIEKFYKILNKNKIA